jgi:hypothetical protein
MLLDPSKLRAINITELWNHWLARQSNGSQGLVFLKAQAEDMREKLSKPKGNKGKQDYVEPDEVQGGDNEKRASGSGGEGRGDNDKGDKGEGGTDNHSDEVHELSPKAHEKSKKDFLKSLSEDPIYQRFINELQLKPQVSHHHSFYRMYPHLCL